MTNKTLHAGDESYLASESLDEALRAAIAAERAGQDFGAAGKVLKNEMLISRRSAMRDEIRGDQICARLSKAMDQMLRSLTRHAGDGLEKKFAICAVGGYGRGELAPYSDIDLLFLHQPADDDSLAEALNPVLYPLWDSGLKIGYAAHTPETAVAFAKEDIVARTAYLDKRFICGDKKLYTAFEASYNKLRKRSIPEFVAAKLKEQDDRQAAMFETRYLVEPDIKEAKGGLRDLQTIRWLYKYAYDGDIGNNKTIDRILESSEKRALKKCERFLWSVRAHLHDYKGRADEKLTFDVQPEIARRLGYADRKNMSAAERLMKHYFVNAVEVGRLTRVLCARLEEERAKRLPRLPKLLPRYLQKDEAPGKPNLRLRTGRLDFESAARARKRPRDLFRLFRAFGKKPKFDFHPNALAIVSEQVPAVTKEIRNDPVVASLFEKILCDSEDPVRVLRIMEETGLLGKYIPPFGSIVGRIDYGLYRRFTLDEHVFRCVGLLHHIRKGERDVDHPIATEIVKNADKPLLFYLGVLLHESGWALNDKSTAGCERLVARVSARLGLSKEEAVVVGWAAAHHLLLVRTAERRNLTESHAIAAFAGQVETRERLDLMMVLSVCHLRMVGHQSWDNIIRRRLTELYELTALCLEDGLGGIEARLAAREQIVRASARAKLTSWSKAEKDAFLHRLHDGILRNVDADMVVRFARLAQASDLDETAAAVVVTAAKTGDLEAMIYADDRPGLLADLAGAVAAAGLSVRNVQALTTKDGKAFDIFSVHCPEGVIGEDKERSRKLHKELLKAASSPVKEKKKKGRRLGDRRELFDVSPDVRIEPEASKDAMVIETEGLDRPGLLHDLTSALVKAGATINSAHIATYGERAVDTFYLQNAKGEKLTDKAALKRIEKSLMAVLSAGS